MINAPDLEATVLAEFPSDTDLKAGDDSTIIDIEGAKLNIRGTDRDKKTLDWAL
jgi:hypothetical protein